MDIMEYISVMEHDYKFKRLCVCIHITWHISVRTFVMIHSLSNQNLLFVQSQKKDGTNTEYSGYTQQVFFDQTHRCFFLINALRKV